MASWMIGNHSLTKPNASNNDQSLRWGTTTYTCLPYLKLLELFSPHKENEWLEND